MATTSGGGGATQSAKVYSSEPVRVDDEAPARTARPVDGSSFASSTSPPTAPGDELATEIRLEFSVEMEEPVRLAFDTHMEEPARVEFSVTFDESAA